MDTKKLRRARERLERAEKEVRETALEMRREGATWQEIADALGVTRQAAWERFGKESK